MKAYKQHPTNKEPNQIIDYLILSGELWLDTFFCIDGKLRGHDLKVKGVNIERYKRIYKIK